MKFLVVLFAISAATSFVALPGFGSSAVKVSSQPCGDTQNIFESTGFAFKNRDKFYVVAPSQFVYSSATYCHKVLGVENKWVTLELLAWDYRGLSLLEIKGTLKEATEFDVGFYVTSTETGAMTKVDIEAYPLGSTQLDKSIQTTLLTNDSERGTFKEMIELTGPAVDQGFVGGIVKQGTSIIGLIANQYLEIHPGRGSTLEFWHIRKPKLVASPMVVQLHDVVDFVKNYEGLFFFKWEQEFFVNPEDQKNGIERVSTGAYEFTSDCPKSSSTSDPGAYPIGGTDPIGIGGGSIVRPGCIVKVGKLKTPQVRHLKALDKNGDYARLSSLSSKSERLEVSYVYKSTAASYLSRNLNYSLLELFSSIERSEYKLMLHAYASGATQPGLSSDLLAIRNLAEDIKVQAKDVYISQKDEADELTLGLVREVYFIASAVMSENYKDVSIEQLEVLMDMSIYQDAWSVIADKKQGNRPNLYKELEQLKTQLKAL